MKTNDRYYVNISEDITDRPGDYDALEEARKRTRGTVGNWGHTTIDDRLYIGYEVEFSSHAGALSKYRSDHNAYSVTRFYYDKALRSMALEILLDKSTIVF